MADLIVQGRPVKVGERVYVHPHFHDRAGSTATVARIDGDCVLLRTSNGAVPTVPASALLLGPHPDCIARDEMAQAGFARPTPQEVRVWKAARAYGVGGRDAG